MSTVSPTLVPLKLKFSKTVVAYKSQRVLWQVYYDQGVVRIGGYHQTPVP